MPGTTPSRTVAVLAGALLVLAPASRTLADGLCPMPEVLDVVARELAKRGAYGVVDVTSVGERTYVGPPATAACAVRVVSDGFDTDRYGYAPVRQVRVQHYMVRTLRNGLEVELLGQDAAFGATGPGSPPPPVRRGG